MADAKLPPVFVCTMTGLVIVVTGMHESEGLGGIAMTSSAFKEGISWFPYVLTASVILFAFSTMLSWSYYGQQACSFIFGCRRLISISDIFPNLFNFLYVYSSSHSLVAFGE